MTLSALLIFAGALLVAAGSPGPSIAALVARVISRGYRSVLPFLAAMWIGEAIWLCLAASRCELSSRRASTTVFVILKYLRRRLSPLSCVEDVDRAGRGEGRRSAQRKIRPGACSCTGMAITLGNPKIMVFYLALLPSLIDLSGITLLLGIAESRRRCHDAGV